MDNIDNFNASIFDNTLMNDLNTLKLAESIHEFFFYRIAIIETNFIKKDKNLLEIMDSINLLTDDVEKIKKVCLNSTNIEEIELKMTGRSNSSSKVNKDLKNLCNENKTANNEITKTTVSCKNSNNEVNVNLKTKKGTYISRSPERPTNKLIFNGGSPKNEKKDDAKQGKFKVVEKIPIQEIVINNPPKSNKLVTTQDMKKPVIERRGSPIQLKGNAHNIKINSNTNLNKNSTLGKPAVKSKIEVIVMGNLNRTGNCSPVNNQSKNVKVQQENKDQEKGSKLKKDANTRKSTFEIVKSRSPEQNKDSTKIIDCSPPRKSLENHNNDTSITSNEKYLKNERTNIHSNGELSAKRKSSNHSNSCSIHENTNSMNNGNSSMLSSCNEVNISLRFTDKLRKFFNNYDNSRIFINLFHFFKLKEKIILKNFSYDMRKKYFESEILQIQKKIISKKSEENPFFNFTLNKEMEIQIKNDTLFLSDYIDDKNVMCSLTFINLINMIYIILYLERSDSKSISDKIEKIEDFILQIDFDRNINSKIMTFIRKLKNNIDIFYILRGVFDLNKDNFLFKFDIPKKFDSFIKFAMYISLIIEQGQNIEVVLDIEILNQKIDILRAYSDKHIYQ